MINNSTQKWEIGQSVKVGFISGLKVLAKIPTPGDYAPDAYVLTRNNTYYKFVPHKGISKLMDYEVEEIMRDMGLIN